MFTNHSLLLKNYIEKFVKLSGETWLALESKLYYKKLPAKTFFTKIGEVEDEIGFVISGSLRHYYEKGDGERTTYFYFENHLLSSYISFIHQQPSLLAIETLEDTELLCFNYSTMQELYTGFQDWQIFGRKVAEYLAIGLEERMVSLLLKSPEERYIELLESNKKKITERIPQQYIASYLGITPVSLSRIRNRIHKMKKK
jgi:CRP-like cAMP-binding protein